MTYAEAILLPKVRQVPRAGLWALIYAHLVVAVLHLAIGSSPFLLAVMTGISLFGLSRALQPQIWPSDGFLITLALYSGTIALLAKAAHFQPLQQNLVVPNYTATALGLGFASSAAAVLAARHLAARKPLSAGVLAFASPRVLRRILLPVFGLGLFTFTLHTALRPRFAPGILDEGPGFGGFGALYFILILAVSSAAWLAFRHQDPLARRVLWLAGGVMLALTLVANTKRQFAEFILTLVLTAAATRLRLRPSRIALLLTGALAFQLYVYPVVQISRASISDPTAFARIVTAWDILTSVRFNPVTLSQTARRVAEGMTYSYRADSSYLYPETTGLDRFFLIQPIDMVARARMDGKTMAFGPLLREAAEAVLPSALISKSSMVGADLLAWDYGIRAFGSIARPVIGSTSMALAVGGLLGVAVVPPILLFPMFLWFNRSFGPLGASALGVQFTVLSWYIAEQGIDSLIGFALRQALLMWLFNLALAWIASRRGTP